MKMNGHTSNNECPPSWRHVAGYSRLMGRKEEDTLLRLKTHRNEIVDPSVAKHRGRIVKTTGDGVLVEFASALDAVRSAIEIQGLMAVVGAGVAPEERIAFRIESTSAIS